VADPKRFIFRSSAIEHYIQSREKDVLPRFVAPPVFTFLWSVVGLLMVAWWIAWSSRVPTYSAGVGIVAAEDSQSGQVDREGVAIVFLPSEQLPKLQPGQPINLRIGTTGRSLHRTIESVEPKILSPSEARQRYRLEPAVLLAITKPSAVVKVKLEGTNLSAAMYEGSILSAQVEVGSRRTISLLPMFDRVIGD
jgi:hypothetical protein